MNLRDLQRGFLASLTGAGPLEGADPRGMRIYANNYRGQLVAALRDTYEKTALWLGDDAFDRYADTYVDAHVPSSWTLDDYGAGFADHLGRAFPDDPEVAELAWLDRALRRAFAGLDTSPLTIDRLVADEWDTVEFVFVPTLGFRRLRTNAAAIWGAIGAGDAPPAALVLDAETGVRVWREGLTPRFASMSALECACLDLALAGGTFGEICTLLEQGVGAGHVAHEAGLLLRAWIADGLVAALRGGDVR
jgi:hypothetical protein